MRVLIVGAIAFVAGALCTLILMNSLRQGTAYPNGVMAVVDAQMKGLNQSVRENRCATSDLAPRLQTLRHLGNDLEPAFLPTQDDALFTRHASDFRAVLDSAVSRTPVDCAAARILLDRVGSECQACHRDFKN